LDRFEIRLHESLINHWQFGYINDLADASRAARQMDREQMAVAADIPMMCVREVE
jgi:hypothetical protein